MALGRGKQGEEGGEGVVPVMHPHLGSWEIPRQGSGRETEVHLKKSHLMRLTLGLYKR